MKSIRRHLTFVLAVAMAALFAASGLLVWVLAKRALTDQFDTALLQRARILEMNIEEDDGELKIDKNLREQDQSEDGATPAVFEVYDATGRLVLSYARGGGHFAEVRKPDGTEPLFYALTLDRAQPGRAVALRMDATDDKQGLFKNLTLITALPASGIPATMRTLALVLSGTGLAALALLVPVLRAALRRGLQPLETLAERTASIDERKLNTRLPEADAPLELKPVVSTLNALLERLETSFARERRFSSDVAHELRTPVAELRSLAELVAGWPAHATPEAFADVLAISREMEDIVSRLTLLSRAESGTQPVAGEPTDLTLLTHEALDRSAGKADERRLVITPHLQAVTLKSDPALWRMILANLIGNAVHHAPPGSAVAVELTRSHFKITNPAPELSPGDLPRLFDRFWRKDASRSGYGHSGLGLPLVQSLAHLMGLRPEATLTTDGHLMITVNFPSDPLPPPGKAPLQAQGAHINPA